MPNKKAKGKKGLKAGRGGTLGDSGGSDDDGSTFNDNESLCSMAVSEVSAAVPDDQMDESSAEEAFESKFKDAIDLASEKAVATRTKGLEALCQGLLKRYMPDFLENQKVTITDIVEKSLKKGKGSEIATASKLALLLGIQLFQPEEMYTLLKGTMLNYATDNTQAATSRASVITGLAGLCFIGGGELAEVVQIMKHLETIFSASLPKKDGSQASHSAETLALHTASLSAWSLLTTLLNPAQIYETINKYTDIMRGLLQASDVDLRIAAGQTLVLLLEGAYEHDEDYEPEDFTGLVAELKQLATDSSKSKSKKDRKEQRSSFRDVLRGVEEGESPSETIKFGREVLKLDSWLKKLQYDWFCKAMGAGINFHLSVNAMIRGIFDLGATINLLEIQDTNKLSKTQRNAANQQAFKMRTQSRGKNRDKRSAVF